MEERSKFHFDNIFAENPPATGPYRIWQVGDYATDAHFVCGKHRQKWLEISFCTSGKCIFWADSMQYNLSAGDVIITRPDRIHDIAAAGNEGIRYYYLAFSIADISQAVESSLNDFFAQAPEYPTQADPSVPSAFQDIFRNILNQDEFSLKLTEDAVRKLLVWTMHSFRKDGGRIYLPEIVSNKNRLLSQICSYLDESVGDMHALKRLPERYGYSYSYLSAVFSKAMGMSPQKYFKMRRHEYALDLLKTGACVTETAAKLGYSSVHVFSSAFSAIEGISPSQYKELSKEK